MCVKNKILQPEKRKREEKKERKKYEKE